MSFALARLARALTHHWKRGLAGALLTLVLIGMAAGAGGPAADDWDVPGTESQQAYDLFREHTPVLAGADSTLVFSVDQGKITDASNLRAVEDALAKVAALPDVGEVGDPFARGGAIAPDGRLASVDVRYAIEPGELEKEHGERLEAAARTAEQDGVDVAMRGIVVDMGQQQEAPVGELVRVAIAIVLLTLLFRSGAAMGATLVGALIGVMVGQMLLAALAQPLGLPQFAAVIAMMLGLGAGIDYSLLVIARLREQL